MTAQSSLSIAASCLVLVGRDNAMVFFFLLFITSDSVAMPSRRQISHHPGWDPPRQIAEATTAQQKMLLFCARSIQYSNDRYSNLISPTAATSAFILGYVQYVSRIIHRCDKDTRFNGRQLSLSANQSRNKIRVVALLGLRPA